MSLESYNYRGDISRMSVGEARGPKAWLPLTDNDACEDNRFI